MVQKIKDFILKDVQSENETKKTAVTLRISALMLCLYFLTLFAVFCAIKDIRSAVICLVCIGCYLVSFYTTYLNHTKFASIFSQALMALWILIFIWEYGWNCGVQHFVFVLLVLNFTVSAGTMGMKIGAAALACAYRIFLYAYTNRYDPVTNISADTGVLFQIINTLAIFGELTAIMIVFTKDSQEMEYKLVKYNEKLEHMASIDPLTGLYNRWSMRSYLEKIVGKYASGEIGYVSVAIGDIDFFKKTNDTYGHDAGDMVLKELAKVFLEVMGKEGKVCRWGGEEFLFVFQNKNGDQANEVLHDILKRIRGMGIPYQSDWIHVTMTFGLEEYSGEKDMEAGIRAADQKLYRGKENGRNQIVY